MSLLIYFSIFIHFIFVYDYFISLLATYEYRFILILCFSVGYVVPVNVIHHFLDDVRLHGTFSGTSSLLVRSFVDTAMIVFFNIMDSLIILSILRMYVCMYVCLYVLGVSCLGVKMQPMENEVNIIILTILNSP